MRTIIDQNGIKWTVTVISSLSVGSDKSPEQISEMTLLFKSNSTEIFRDICKQDLEAFSDNELLDILSLNEKDESQ